MWSYNGNPEATCAKAYGKRITSISLMDERLTLGFNEGSKLELWDDGQDCCESRYMNCDDDLGDFCGAVLYQVCPGREVDCLDDGSCSVHDIQFLELRTSAGVLSVANHNEHNGYYGGFGVTAKFTDGEGKV